MNADGTPFFWLGDTGWLLPEKLNRDEAAYYLEHCRQAGFNVVQDVYKRQVHFFVEHSLHT